ncbi:accessory Sec system protein Asp2 [Fructobacillus papyrifericola]|uniref:Accessory Sec system protein Asp2 n=1 Tax=Fructobacillus papyrifericola TaxID=2713172 RepID=A0ABS5QTD1_9LACO|nr:accessory Sec system protein Asp2 [Fructobacillus papyrifericola]MBS9336187.1 accessory Sec system protein Asp2 [Fructobacillus papyrifericola]
MAEAMAILQIGKTDLTAGLSRPTLAASYCKTVDLPVFLAGQKNPKKLSYDYVLLTDDGLDSALLARQIRDWPAYRVLYTGSFGTFSPAVQAALHDRGAFFLEEEEKAALADRIEGDLYQGQVGFATRFSEDQFEPADNYAWHWQRAGRFQSKVSGDFGKDYQQIGTLKTFPGDFQPGQENLIYLDYESTGDVEVALSYVFFQNGGLQSLKLFENPDAKHLPTVRAPKDYQDYQIIVLAKGLGELTLKNLHQRKSRHGLGYFLPAGERLLTRNGEEVHAYFNPGQKKGPLVVCFAGTRLHVEGFEMMGPLDDLGYPYLLFTDTRAQGGAFMVGDADFEELVMARIAEAENVLGEKEEKTIFTGYSMGSYPAMYYAAKMKGQHFVIAKPIVHLGSFTGNGAFAHQGVNRDWPLDVRLVLTGRLDMQDNEALNQKLWSAFESVDWSTVQIDLFNMTQDDYDQGAAADLVDYWKTHGDQVGLKEETGFHEEKIDQMVAFLKKAIRKQAKEQEGGFY